MHPRDDSPDPDRAERRRRAARIVRRLAKAYPDARCALDFRNPFELLVATILSAQCTDKKVNEVTPVLFAAYRTPAALAEADPSAVEAMIRPTGFYRQKTRAIQSAARGVAERFGGVVPNSIEDLVSLHGVARKTANVVLGNAFGVPGLSVDTHMKRVNLRLGLTSHDDPEKIERDLMELIPEREWTAYSHRVIHHGRVCCDARRPRCETCPLEPECAWPRSTAPSTPGQGGRSKHPASVREASARSPQGAEGAAQRGEAERSSSSRKPSEVNRWARP